MRAPAVAGSFYEAEPGALRAHVEACFTHPLGPGRRPEPARGGPRSLKAIVVPHAGLAYSGPVAAHAYLALAESGLPEAVVVVGPNHGGAGGPADLSGEDWRTPLGVARVHEGLLKALEGGIVERREASHASEHSIEVQLPFVQWLAERAGCEVRFVAIAMSAQDEVTGDEVGEALAAALRSTGCDAVLVASSDLMHAGPNYRIRPPRGERVDAWVRAQDAHALEAIEALDPHRLQDVVRARDISMCGHGPVAAVMEAARRLGAREARVLAHATSYDIEPHHSAVGYAAVAIA